MEEKEQEVEFEEKENEEQKPKVQSREENARYAQMRREKTYRDGLREGLKTNPFTGEKMVDDYDLEVYEVMEKLNKEGKDPLKEYPRYVMKKAKEENDKRKMAEEHEKQVQEDIKKFNEQFPDVDLANLREDSDFVDYADGKWGRKDLTEIYKGFLKIKKTSEEKKKPRAMPTSQSGKEETKKSISDMSEEEVHKLFAEKYGRYS